MGSPVDRRALIGLILVSQSIIFEELEFYNDNTYLPIEPLPGGGYGQTFEYTLFDGVNITVANAATRAITLGNMRDLLKGLRLYLSDRLRSRECYFEWSVGYVGIIGMGFIERETYANARDRAQSWNQSWPFESASKDSRPD